MILSLTCSLEIFSSKTLEEVADLVSQRILGGIRFIGREEYIYDEVPAIYAERNVFGLRIVLQGYGADEPYFLEMHDDEPLDPQVPVEIIKNSLVDISGYVSRLLQGIEGIHVSLK